MLDIKKTIEIKFKLSLSTFESLNSKAYATLSRPLGIKEASANAILSHETFTANVFPAIIGVSIGATNWIESCREHIMSHQIVIPKGGLPLTLDHTFNMDDLRTKDNIAKFIEDYKCFDIIPEVLDEKKVVTTPAKKKLHSEKAIYNKIMTLDVMELQKYFNFRNAVDYLRWCIAVHSNEVANEPDLVDKSTNIRFFLFDANTERKREISKYDKISGCITELLELKNQSELLKAVAFYTGAANMFDSVTYSDEDFYILLFKQLQSGDIDKFESAVSNKSLILEVDLRRAVAKGLITETDEGWFVLTETPTKKYGRSVADMVAYFQATINDGELTLLKSKIK